MQENDIVGYRLEWKPGEYLHYSPEDYRKEVCKSSARVWGLFREPQAGCSSDVAVYKGGYWVQPKYLHGRKTDDLTAMFLGPVLHEPNIAVG